MNKPKSVAGSATVPAQKLQRLADLVAAGDKTVDVALKEAKALVKRDDALRPVLRTLLDTWEVTIDEAQRLGIAGLTRALAESGDEKVQVAAAKALTKLPALSDNKNVFEFEERRSIKVDAVGAELLNAIQKAGEEKHARDTDKENTAARIPVSPRPLEREPALTGIIDIGPVERGTA